MASRATAAPAGRRSPRERPPARRRASCHPDFVPVAADAALALLGRATRAAPPSASTTAASAWSICGAAIATAWHARGSATRCRRASPPRRASPRRVLHVLADRGLLDYDRRVAATGPSSRRPARQRITVRHVLAHQSGLYHIRQMVDRAERMLDWEYMIHAIERAAPVHEPGTRTGYHGLTYGFLVGELVQRVTGSASPQLVRELIAEPLGLDGLYVGAPPDQLCRAREAHLAASGVCSLLGPVLVRVAGRELGDCSPARRACCSACSIWSASARPAEHPRRARAARHRRLRLRRRRDAAGRDPGRERPVHRARRWRACTRRSRAAASSTACGCSRPRRSRARPRCSRRRRPAPRHPLRHALAARLPRRPHHARDAAACVRPLRLRRLGRVGRPAARAGRGADREQRHGTPFGDLRIARIGGAALGCADERRRTSIALPLPEPAASAA